MTRRNRGEVRVEVRQTRALDDLMSILASLRLAGAELEAVQTAVVPLPVTVPARKPRLRVRGRVS